MKKKIKKFPALKKNIKDFLLSEEGRMTKKDIIKIGMSLAVLSSIFTPTQFAASHGSNLGASGGTGYHNSHASHGSHGSHGSHCSGMHGSGW